MSLAPSDIDFVQELFAPLGDITHRRMMGGLTIYHIGQVFAMLDSQGTPYLKAKGNFAQELAQSGARQFIFTNKSGKASHMGYWTVPDSALDDPEMACEWARKALSAL